MRRKSKGFDYADGIYYFTIKSTPNNITIHRTNKADAAQSYIQYCKLGKNVEWHGRREGKKFVDSTPPSTKE